MASKPNALDAWLKVRVRGDFKKGVADAAAEEGLTAAEMVRKALDEYMGASSPEVRDVVARAMEAVVPEVRRQVREALADAAPAPTAHDPEVARALEAIGARLDRIEAGA